MGEGGRSVTIFCQKCLCLTVPRIFVGENSVFHKISVIENFHG